MQNKEWKKGDPIYINKLYWGEPEIQKLMEVAEGDWWGGNSKFNIEFEKLMADFSGLKYFQSTNSGSAALELAINALFHKGLLKRGDKVLHPVLTFPTSISHAILMGLEPVYVDVGKGTYVIDDESMRNAFQMHKDIKAAIIPALLGNAPNIDLLLELLNGKPLILDSCDTIGTKWNERELSSYGTLGCYSFYGSHHISTAGVGGGVGTNDEELSEIIKSMTFWGRDNSIMNGDRITSFLKRYSYKTIGKDAQMSAIQAAFGVAQFQRLPEYLGDRNRMFIKLQRLFSRKLNYFILPERVSDKADVSWFCYPIVVRDEAPFDRKEMVNYLLDNNIEVRPPMTFLLDNDVYTKNYNYHMVGSFYNAEKAYNKGFFIGSYSMSDEQEKYYFDVLESFLNKY